MFIFIFPSKFGSRDTEVSDTRKRRWCDGVLMCPHIRFYTHGLKCGDDVQSNSLSLLFDRSTVIDLE